jgi:DNA-binding MarR family transcriptional regulator
MAKAAHKTADGKRRRHGAVDMTPLSGIVGYRLRIAQLAVFSDFIKTFASMRIRPVDYSILRLTEANPGVRQGALAEALGMKRANMVGLVHALEARGLIERGPVDGDRRSNALSLTPRGADFVAKMQEEWIRHEEGLIDRLGGEVEKERLVDLLRRLERAVETQTTRLSSALRAKPRSNAK